jgi:hypothetical protein
MNPTPKQRSVMEKDEELLKESLSAILVLKTVLRKVGLHVGETRADEIIKKIQNRLYQEDFDSENPPQYHHNLKV